MLDTNILIYLLKHHPPEIAARVDALAPADSLCMSFVTYAELLKGAARSTRKAEVVRRLDRLTRQLPDRRRHLPPVRRAVHPPQGRWNADRRQ